MQHIPLIDLHDTKGVVAAIELACRDIGFMYVAGHDIPVATIDGVRSAATEYFSLPVEQKLQDQITPDNYRGYIPLGFFSPNDGSDKTDAYEGYKLHYESPEDDPVRAACHLYGPNKWPAGFPALRAAISEYWRECDRVCAVLLTALANIMGVPSEEFLRHFVSPLTNMTLLHYPPQESGKGGFGIHPHKDTAALTILAPDPVGGLMVRCRDEREWIAAEPPGDALTVNIGDLLELWSGGYFVSTPHKVVNATGKERYSFPYFAVPRFDTVVAPLNTTQPGFERDSVHVGEVSAEVWRTNWPDTVSSRPEFDLGTLEN